MKALSIRQPWAWLIANGYKDVENRVWKRQPKYRGQIYIHASKGCTKAEYADAVAFAASIDPSIKIPPLEELQRGGLIAKALLTGCVTQSLSPWFTGPLGLVLDKVEKIEFVPCKGQLGFFDLRSGPVSNHTW